MDILCFILCIVIFSFTYLSGYKLSKRIDKLEKIIYEFINKENDCLCLSL